MISFQRIQTKQAPVETPTMCLNKEIVQSVYHNEMEERFTFHFPKMPSVRLVYYTQSVFKRCCLVKSCYDATYLSTLENVWPMAAERLACRHTPVTSVDELGHRVEAAWASIYTCACAYHPFASV
ncbi:hypothetical protein TNCV_1009551 [Trichonephila clavipes]|nr:hypothetical protein TNCV_1009551 [Trichonephila clavipes]